MKTKNIDVYGVYSISNTGGIEVHIEEGYDPFILWRYAGLFRSSYACITV